MPRRRRTITVDDLEVMGSARGNPSQPLSAYQRYDAIPSWIATAPRSVDLDELAVSMRSPVVRSSLTEDEDNRLYAPGLRLPRSSRRRRVPIKARTGTSLSSYSSKAGRAIAPSWALYFGGSRHVLRCVRRKVRRGVILAKGKGGGRHRPPRRNFWSTVWC